MEKLFTKKSKYIIGIFCFTLLILVAVEANGINRVDEMLIEPPSSLISKSVHHVSCFGGTDGSITLSPLFGNPPYQFIWSNGASTSTIDGLLAGMYYVTVISSNTIAVSDSVQVIQPNAVTLNSTITKPCIGTQNGAIVINAVSGGSFPYHFLWSTSSTVPSLQNAGAGVYSLMVTDSKRCTSSFSYSVNEDGGCLANCCNPGFVLEVDSFFNFELPYNFYSDFSVSNSCDSSSYLITNNSNNKCSSFKFENDHTSGSGKFFVAEGSPTQPNKKIWSLKMNLIAGKKYAIDAYFFLRIDSTKNAMSFCYYANNRLLACFDSTGLDKNSWSRAPFCFTALQDDSVISIVQSNFGGAFGIDDITLFRCNPQVIPPLVIGGKVEATCPGFNSDTIHLEVVTTYPPIHIHWWDSIVASTRPGLPIGFYPFKVVDSLGNFTLDTLVVSAAPIETNSLVTPVACKNSNTGAISLSVIGGTGNYFYMWSNGSSAQNQMTMHAGTYTVYVADSQGCTSTSTYTLAQASSALILNMSKINIKCGGKATGSIIALPTGGIVPYHFAWSNGASVSQINKVVAGTYTCTVTDAVGCTKTVTLTLTQNQPLVVNTVPISATQASAVAAGGVFPYSFMWNTIPNQTTNTAILLTPGHTYKVRITDYKNCSQTAVLTMPGTGNRINISPEMFSATLYPNPSKGIIHIEFNFQEALNFNFQLFNSIGQMVFDKAVLKKEGENTMSFDFAKLTKGLYLLNLQTGNACLLSKIVLE